MLIDRTVAVFDILSFTIGNKFVLRVAAVGLTNRIHHHKHFLNILIHNEKPRWSTGNVI